MNIFSIKIRLPVGMASKAFPFIALLMIPFVYATTLLEPGLYLRYAALAVLMLLFLIFGRLEKYTAAHNLLLYRVFVFYGLYALITALSAIWAVNPSEALVTSFNRLLLFSFLVVAVLLVHRLENPQKLLLRIFITFVFIISAAGIYQMTSLLLTEGWDHQVSYKVSLVFGHRNLFAQLLMLGFPFAIAGIEGADRFWKVTGAIAGLFAIVLIVMLLVKSVWIGLLATIFAGLTALLLSGRREKGFRKILMRTTVFILLTATVAGAVIVVWSKYNSSELFAKQTIFITNYKFGSSLERVDMWQRTLHMIRDHPVSGVGAGNWRFHFPSYGMQGMRSEEGIIHFQRPHNDLLWVWSESGTPAMLIYLLMWGGIFYYLFRMLIRSAPFREKVIDIAVFASLTGYLTISMFSFPLERPAHNIFSHMLFALIIVRYSRIHPLRKELSMKGFSILWVILILITAFAAFLNISKVKSEYFTRQAFEARSLGNNEAVIANIEKAFNTFSTIDPMATPLPWYSGSAHFNIGNTDAAAKDFRKALKIHPNHIHVLNNLATCYVLQDKHEQAVSLYEKALDIAPAFTDGCLNLAAAHYNRQKLDLALKAIGRCRPDTIMPKYEQYLDAILLKKTNEFLQTIDDPWLRTSATRIRNSREWMRKVFRQSISDTVNYNRMIITETLYLLEEVDSNITADEASAYRKNFEDRPWW